VAAWGKPGRHTYALADNHLKTGGPKHERIPWEQGK